MNISQVTAKDDEALEYLNVLVTVELAAEIHRDKPNTAIRKTVARLLPRMNHPRVKAIMVGLARQASRLDVSVCFAEISKRLLTERLHSSNVISVPPSGGDHPANLSA